MTILIARMLPDVDKPQEWLIPPEHAALVPIFDAAGSISADVMLKGVQGPSLHWRDRSGKRELAPLTRRVPGFARRLCDALQRSHPGVRRIGWWGVASMRPVRSLLGRIVQYGWMGRWDAADRIAAAWGEYLHGVGLDQVRPLWRESNTEIYSLVNAVSRHFSLLYGEPGRDDFPLGCTPLQPWLLMTNNKPDTEKATLTEVIHRIGRDLAAWSSAGVRPVFQFMTDHGGTHGEVDTLRCLERDGVIRLAWPVDEARKWGVVK